MPPKHDYYETLKVSRKATPDEIRQSYKRLARKYHPDLNPGDKAAEDRFKNVQEAYDVLSDAKKRQMYDQVGFYSDNAYQAGGGAPRGEPGMDFGGFDFTDFFKETGAGTRGREAAGGAPGGGRFEEQTGGNFRDLFSKIFRGGGGGVEPEPVPEKGSDLEYALNIDFWQAIRGTQAALAITRHEVCATCQGTGAAGRNSVTCPQCNGTGTVSQMAGAMRFNLTCPRCGGSGHLRNACPTCHGDGRVPRTDKVEVRIPPGAQNGSRLRVAGKGNAGTLGAPPGDLYITTRVEPHPFFEREGDDIHIRVPVTMTEAGLGAEIEVPTIDGRARLKIRQGTQNGQKYRLREKGVFNARRNKRGDQIVEVYIKVPDVRDERTRELLRELGRVQQEDPRSEIWPQV
ncbi:MAG: DnaJ C-terminal domain-containing protein [Bryobacteraceae bacterium]